MVINGWYSVCLVDLGSQHYHLFYLYVGGLDSPDRTLCLLILHAIYDTILQSPIQDLVSCKRDSGL